MTAEFDPSTMTDAQLDWAAEHRHRLIRGEIVPLYALPLDRVREELGMMSVEYAIRRREENDHAD